MFVFIDQDVNYKVFRTYQAAYRYRLDYLNECTDGMTKDQFCEFDDQLEIVDLSNKKFNNESEFREYMFSTYLCDHSMEIE